MITQSLESDNPTTVGLTAWPRVTIITHHAPAYLGEWAGEVTDLVITEHSHEPRTVTERLSGMETTLAGKHGPGLCSSGRF